ncbi:MAG: hypothetical protein WBQ68_13440 [Terriglobales bacterium]
MILSFTLIFLALAILVVLLYLEGGQHSPVKRLEDLQGHTRRVDLDAFRNLVDPAEDDYLRAHLLPRQFRAIQRKRMLAALEYVQNSAHNAAFLLRMGEAASRNADPRVAQAGKELTNSALRLRAYVLLFSAQLYVRMIFPQGRLSYGGLADSYQSLSALAGRLILMQHPTQAARLSALL